METSAKPPDNQNRTNPVAPGPATVFQPQKEVTPSGLRMGEATVLPFTPKKKRRFGEALGIDKMPSPSFNRAKPSAAAITTAAQTASRGLIAFIFSASANTYCSGGDKPNGSKHPTAAGAPAATGKVASQNTTYNKKPQKDNNTQKNPAPSSEGPAPANRKQNKDKATSDNQKPDNHIFIRVPPDHNWRKITAIGAKQELISLIKLNVKDITYFQKVRTKNKIIALKPAAEKYNKFYPPAAAPRLTPDATRAPASAARPGPCVRLPRSSSAPQPPTIPPMQKVIVEVDSDEGEEEEITSPAKSAIHIAGSDNGADCINLVFINCPALTRVEHSLNLGSDHYTVITNLPKPLRTTPGAGKKYIPLECWEDFGQLIHSFAWTLPMVNLTIPSKTNLDKCAKALQDLFKQVIEAAGKTRHQNGHSAPWWSEKCKAAHKAYTELTDGSPAKEEARKILRSTVRRSKQAHWDGIIAEASATRNIWSVAK
ncbi:hypothetical protein J3F84DRAFT_392386 [Trichoderma pleuroticola]